MDVETILDQIRNRVIEAEEAPVSSTVTHGNGAAASGAANGSGARSSLNESLARASAHLQVTGRAWDRLPPVFSNRSGAIARLELWIKRTCRPLTRWFTWEQVNFNRSVNEALSEVIEILKVEANELASLRTHLTNEMHREFVTLRSEIGGQAVKLDEHAAGLDEQTQHLEQLGGRLHETNEALARLSKMLGSSTDEARDGHSQLVNKLHEVALALRAEQQAGKSANDEELNRRLADLAAELREEQRVCFHQLSLETSESAVLEDRGRRELLARLEQLEASRER